MYPNNYRNSSTCLWEISVPRGFKIVLNFIVFDLGSSDCSTDFITIGDANDHNARIMRYCAGVSHH